jgi:hypothetical protein
MEFFLTLSIKGEKRPRSLKKIKSGQENKISGSKGMVTAFEKKKLEKKFFFSI